jgi:hypothetical protein
LDNLLHFHSLIRVRFFTILVIFGLLLVFIEHLILECIAPPASRPYRTLAEPPRTLAEPPRTLAEPPRTGVVELVGKVQGGIHYDSQTSKEQRLSEILHEFDIQIGHIQKEIKEKIWAEAYTIENIFKNDFINKIDTGVISNFLLGYLCLYYI